MLTGPDQFLPGLESDLTKICMDISERDEN